ncbi:CBF/Mak21 family-domain-containing protein [Xylaria bambusicola]|uniref:CBF/Mak21 family-domain-containing protein n=1 Tax=Xylaria bambusicola TaxID=326684 RepID=UPI00200736D2|nr:CBF/Mak21 family-domain-containing protein [Xylaria bambusicola]KAI0525787.1 CBF/Mak21 family-domain-containing protein [Xylaria bambusicola]
MATFDEAALSKLTARLDSKLAEAKRPDHKSSKGKRKLDQSADVASPPAKKRNHKGRPDQSNKAKPNGKSLSNPVKPNFQSRDRPSKPQDRKHNGPQRDDPNFLLDEIKALGGDEDDFALVGDIDSDEEAVNNQTSSKSADKKLRDELATFAAGLGFDQVQQDAGSEQSDAEGDYDGEIAFTNNEKEDDEAQVDDDDEDEESLTTQTPKGKTVFEPRPDWYAVEVKSLPDPISDDVAPFMATITSLKNYAKTILDEDTAAYNTTFAASSSRKFMSTIMSSGTMSDKVSALTLAIQESPAHNIKAFDNLMSLGAKRSRGTALAALAALVDLLGPGMILPSDRRLRTFTSQLGLIGTLQKYNVTTWSAEQGLPGRMTKAHLILWYFEDWLKDAYFKMIQSLEVWCDDEVEYARTKAIDQVFALLRDKPEQESNLLRLLVNKLGDRDRKIASRSSYLLLQLLTTHPRMKQVVVRSIEQDVIFRPGQNNRAKYYAVNTLNQTILSTKEPELADSLLRVYFGMFLSLLKNGELGHLDGALEGSKPEKKGKNKRKPKLPKDAEEKTKAGAGETEAAEKLVSAILTGVNRAVPFSQADQSTLESHLDTLFRITHSSNFNTSIQALMLIQQLSANRQLATERYYRTLYESLLDPRLITSSKQALYLNLLYRSLKADVDVRRVKAFVKRMLQILNLHQPSFVCGILYLAIELSVAFPDINTLVSVPEENDIEETAPSGAPNGANNDASDGLHEKHAVNVYDGRKRNPEYSNAHLSCLWELLPFFKHYHPSVDVYAKNLLKGEKAGKKPELANHTLIAFLDKFVYKNAKATDQAKGASIMQPIAASGQSQVLLSSKSSMKDIDSVNSASFWNKKSGEVAVEDAFFHEYFTQMGKPGQAERQQKRKTKNDATGDEEEDDEEAKEDEIWDALVNSRPEIQEDSDDGADFDDMMSLDDSEKEFRQAMEEEDDEDEFNLDDSDVEISGDDIDDDEDDEAEDPASKDEKKDGKPQSERTKKRKALKALPLFASADDYAEMLAQDADGM